MMTTTTTKLKVIDCDSHFWQPLALWKKFIDDQYRDPIATAVDHVIVGKPLPGGAFVSAKTRGGAVLGALGENHRGGDHADARLEWMDAEGIDVQVIYPTMMALLPCLPDPNIASASARALNRYAADFASAAPDRLKPCMVLPFYHPQRALEEFHYASGDLGLEAAFCPPTPSAERAWSDPELDPLWQAMQDAGVPLTFHEFPRFPDGVAPLAARSSYKNSPLMLSLCGRVVEAELALMDMILGGVLHRFPKLRVGIAEAFVAWLPSWLALMDRMWDRAMHKPKTEFTGSRPRRGAHGPHAEFTLLPADQFRRQGFVIAFPDDLWLEETIKFVGDGNVMIGSDFPHSSAVPNAVETFKATTPGLSDATQRKVLSENPQYIYGFK
jgi:predicted TIM-barrel fold metal-dependent hydrolase